MGNRGWEGGYKRAAGGILVPCGVVTIQNLDCDARMYTGDNIV